MRASRWAAETSGSLTWPGRVLEPKATASPSDRDDPKPLAFGEAGPLTRQVMEQKPKNYLGSMFESSF